MKCISWWGPYSCISCIKIKIAKKQFHFEAKEIHYTVGCKIKLETNYRMWWKINRTFPIVSSGIEPGQSRYWEKENMSHNTRWKKFPIKGRRWQISVVHCAGNIGGRPCNIYWHRALFGLYTLLTIAEGNKPLWQFDVVEFYERSKN